MLDFLCRWHDRQSIGHFQLLFVFFPALFGLGVISRSSLSLLSFSVYLTFWRDLSEDSLWTPDLCSEWTDAFLPD